MKLVREVYIQTGKAMNISINSKGEWSKTFNFLNKASKSLFHKSLFTKYGEMGVRALQEATPKDTGDTANSWSYEIEENEGSVRIIWKNSSTTKDGIPIVVLLHYGHGTRNGGYVQGRDFINPAMQPIFDKIAAQAWEEVVRL